MVHSEAFQRVVACTGNHRTKFKDNVARFCFPKLDSVRLHLRKRRKHQNARGDAAAAACDAGLLAADAAATRLVMALVVAG